MVITACTPRSAEGRGRTLLEGPVLLWTPQLSAQGAVTARQALAVAAALLSYWLAPQWAPPPSKRPLVSSCPPATVSGPAQPLVGVSVGPAPCHPLYKSPNSDRGRWFVDTIACRVVCWLSSCYSLFQQLISRFADLWRCEQSELGLGNVFISFLLKKRLKCSRAPPAFPQRSGQGQG